MAPRSEEQVHFSAHIHTCLRLVNLLLFRSSGPMSIGTCIEGSVQLLMRQHTAPRHMDPLLVG